jgi:DNA-binding transcriptional ArsR family regulator
MQAVDLDAIFQALADPYRRAMVSRLVQSGPASMKELAAPFDLGLPSTLKHLKVLENGGIITSTKEGRVRTFSIRPDGFDSLRHWLDQHQIHLETGFDRLAAAMAAHPEEAKGD